MKRCYAALSPKQAAGEAMHGRAHAARPLEPREVPGARPSLPGRRGGIGDDGRRRRRVPLGGQVAPAKESEASSGSVVSSGPEGVSDLRNPNGPVRDREAR